MMRFLLGVMVLAWWPVCAFGGGFLLGRKSARLVIAGGPALTYLSLVEGLLLLAVLAERFLRHA